MTGLLWLVCARCLSWVSTKQPRKPGVGDDGPCPRACARMGSRAPGTGARHINGGMEATARKPDSTTRFRQGSMNVCS
jgi:hypothetical protein